MWLARQNGLLPNVFVSIDLIVTVLWGVVIGARLGYVLFYGGDEFYREPWRIISPYDFQLKEWIGIRGMSFHGGLIGGAVGLWMFTREASRHFLEFADALVQAVPIALLFGRIGNFLNLEIIGKTTTSPWGMQIPFLGEALRHPVTLYEATGEGLILFALLFLGSRVLKSPGRLSGLFLLSYASFRIAAEFFRNLPEGTNLIFGFFTMGQALSLGMVMAGLVLLFWPRPRVV
ncbi:MAG: prolipoprotein diacylglyceryl transferase [Undibacterium sp.]